MPWILVAALITATPKPLTVELPALPAAERIAVDLPTGSLLFSQGDCLAGKVFTFSPYTHVGTVVDAATLASRFPGGSATTAARAAAIRLE